MEMFNESACKLISSVVKSGKKWQKVQAKFEGLELRMIEFTQQKHLLATLIRQRNDWDQEKAMLNSKIDVYFYSS